MVKLIWILVKIQSNEHSLLVFLFTSKFWPAFYAASFYFISSKFWTFRGNGQNVSRWGNYAPINPAYPQLEAIHSKNEMKPSRLKRATKNKNIFSLVKGFLLVWAHSQILFRCHPILISFRFSTFFGLFYRAFFEGKSADFGNWYLDKYINFLFNNKSK